MKGAAWVREAVILGTIVAGLGLAVGAAWRTGGWDVLALLLGVELLGVGLTWLALERAARRIEERHAEKATLIAQLGSPIRDVATAAADKLRWHSWLFDGTLCGANLERANLQGAYLWQANLEGSRLQAANLQGADLGQAHLRRAVLRGANLQEADLWQCDLRAANLELADLGAASLGGANLESAALGGANLNGAELHGAILPDGQPWAPEVELDRFTDLTHPDFWSGA